MFWARPLIALSVVLATVVLVGSALELVYSCPRAPASAAAGETTSPSASAPASAAPQRSGASSGAGSVTAPGPEGGDADSSASLGCFGQRLAGLPLGLLTSGAAAAGIVLAALVALRLRALLAAPPQLVVEDLTDASGAEEIDGIAPGLSRSLREWLLPELRRVRHEWNRTESVRQGEAVRPDSGHPTQKAPLPEGAVVTREKADETLDALLASLSESAPEAVSPAIKLLGLAFPARGTAVSGALRRTGDAPDRLGVTLQVADMREEQERSIRGLWEPLGAHGRVGRDNHDVRGQEQEGFSPTPYNAQGQTQGQTQGQGDEEEAAARGLYALGEVYEEAGAFGRAKTLYEEALGKLPAFAEARDALRRLVGEETSLAGRYEALMRPAARWLALEVHGREVERRYGGQLGDEERARLHNFYGVLYQTSAPEFGRGHADFFYDLAVGEFRRAIAVRVGWYQPLENLADTHGMRDREDKELQSRAVLAYDDALGLVPRNVQDERQRELVELRIRAARAASMLLTREEGMAREAREEAALVKSGCERIAREIFPEEEPEEAGTGRAEDPAHRDAENTGEQGRKKPAKKTGEQGRRLAYALYNLACYHATSARLEVEDRTRRAAAGEARKYLAYALARDGTRDLWGWAGEDEDLAGIRDGFRGPLTSKLLERSRNKPELHTMPQQEFENEVQAILASVA